MSRGAHYSTLVRLVGGRLPLGQTWTCMWWTFLWRWLCSWSRFGCGCRWERPRRRNNVFRIGRRPFLRRVYWRWMVVSMRTRWVLWSSCCTWVLWPNRASHQCMCPKYGITNWKKKQGRKSSAYAYGNRRNCCVLSSWLRPKYHKFRSTNEKSLS